MSGNYIDKWNANGQMYDIQDAGRGLPNGVATLDLDGRIPYSQLPESAIEFKGYWNADTNTPTLADGTGTKGDMYYVSVAGVRDLGSGTQRFYVGDRVLYDGSVWKNMNPDLIDLFLPVGHLIWTSNANFNPNTQYPGTTWTQIKDKFILAAGDTYTNGDTGGSATVTLTTEQIPSHSHTTISQSASTTSDNNRGHTHSIDHGHTAQAYYASSGGSTGFEWHGSSGSTGSNPLGRIDVSTHYGSSGGASQTHTHTYSHTHTTDSVGGLDGVTQAHDNMPPYVVKYCWERTA